MKIEGSCGCLLFFYEKMEEVPKKVGKESWI